MSDTPESTAEPEAAKPEAAKVSNELQSVIIRPWPKVVFLYPTFVAATIFWFIEALTGGGASAVAEVATEVATEATGEQPAAANEGSLGNIFMGIMFLNLLIFSFDFSRIKSITIVVAIIAVALGIGWADSQWGILGGIQSVLGSVNIQMNAQFYGFMSGMLALILALVLINTRFSYYEINHREILHHHGYLGDITRMPTTGLRFNKEIYDLMEFALLKSGRLIFYPSTSREAIVIDNVVNVNSAENRIKDLLSVVAVRISDQNV